MNGVELKQLQIDRGTRKIVESIDDLRCSFGFDSIIVQTPVVETRLRSGMIPLRPLILAYRIPQDFRTVQMTVPISYPVGSIKASIFNPDGQQIATEEIEGSNSLSHTLKAVVENLIQSDSINENDSYTRENIPLRDLDLIDDEPIDLDSLTFFTCRNCRFCIGDSSNLETHSSNISSDCTSLFLQEPPTFHSPSEEENEGKILCPKCHAKIGAWSWVGLKCSCGSWIAPAFQIVKSKVDMKPYVL